MDAEGKPLSQSFSNLQMKNPTLLATKDGTEIYTTTDPTTNAITGVSIFSPGSPDSPRSPSDFASGKIDLTMGPKGRLGGTYTETMLGSTGITHTLPSVGGGGAGPLTFDNNSNGSVTTTLTNGLPSSNAGRYQATFSQTPDGIRIEGDVAGDHLDQLLKIFPSQ